MKNINQVRSQMIKSRLNRISTAQAQKIAVKPITTYPLAKVQHPPVAPIVAKKNIFSFCIFGNNSRYWNCVPLAIVTNRLLHPQHTIRLYVHQGCLYNQKFSQLQQVASRDGKIQIRMVNEQVVGTKPTIWRMKPLWQQDVDIFHCRDIDAVPNHQQVKAVSFFQRNSQYIAMGMRSHPAHTILFLAGMCGFRRQEMSQGNCKSYNQYVSFAMNNCKLASGWIWGCDQQLLTQCFVKQVPKKNHKRYAQISLDNAIGETTDLRLSTTKIRVEQEQIPNINIAALDICNQLCGGYLGMALSAQHGAGNGVMSNGLKRLLDLDSNICSIIKDIYR